VTNVRCLPVYQDVFPEGADTAKIAYHFLADYPSDTHRHIDLVRNLNARIRTWVRAWERGYRWRPELKLCNYQDHYVLFDTRGLPGTQTVRHIDTQEAELLMNAKPYRHTKQEDQAIAGHLAVAVDNWFVPLVVAREGLFRELSKEDKIRRHAVAA
jgi:hypothetical protein